MIIILNGTSSSGKTSIANKLLEKLNAPYFFFSVDNFLSPSMPQRINFEIPEDLKLIDESISGFNKALGAYASHIEYMIVDHVLQNPKWYDEIFNSLNRKDVLFIGVTAPLSIIEERENKREDRKSGTARAQYEQMSKFTYDLIVDTSKMSPDECANLIINQLTK